MLLKGPDPSSHSVSTFYQVYLFQITEPDKCNLYDTVVFEGPPKTEQTLWPRHCVQESWGAELHKDLKVRVDMAWQKLIIHSSQVHPNGRVIHKGVNPNIDSYSAFYDNAKLGKTCLEEMIRKEGCADLYICGIATDVCVGM